jgi:hypothetical protein
LDQTSATPLESNPTPPTTKFFISISGHESTRRSFLTLIRDTFAHIHQLKNFSVQLASIDAKIGFDLKPLLNPPWLPPPRLSTR